MLIICIDSHNTQKLRRLYSRYCLLSHIFDAKMSDFIYLRRVVTEDRQMAETL